MKNPIKFEKKQNMSNDLKIKLIVFNVVEYLNNKYSHNIVKIKFNGDSDFRCNYTHKSDNIEHDLELLFNIRQDDIYIEFYKIDDFLKGYNIHKIELARYVFVLLHEIGHAVTSMYLYNRFNDNFIKYSLFQDNIFSSVYSGLYLDNMTEYEDFYMYQFNPYEAMSTMFAYQNFYDVYKMLESRGLV